MSDPHSKSAQDVSLQGEGRRVSEANNSEVNNSELENPEIERSEIKCSESEDVSYEQIPSKDTCNEDAVNKDAINKSMGTENINYVTPYAFSISERIYGLPLAKPRQRLMALFIDAILIAMLTLVSYVVLFGLYAGLFLNAARHFKSKDKNPLVRKLLRGVGVFCFIIFTFGSLSYFFGEPKSAENVAKDSVLQKSNEQNTNEQNTNEQKSLELEGVSPEKAETKEEIQEKETLEKAVVKTEISETTVTATEKSNSSEKTETVKESDNLEEAKQKGLPDISQGLWPWVEAVLKHFGVSFGWAAFYFSIFVGWFSGQTPGKHLMGIKVIKLDGEDLNLWEAFGRYGGYAAGFATGLVGFLQVYWDPNRQAIQDKISGTLVIDTKGERLK